MRAIRKEPKSSNGWNNGDIDELICMFCAAMVWDGNHPSKSSRDYLIANGYAFSYDGQTSLTGKGKIAALFQWPMPKVWFSRVRRLGLKSAFRTDQLGSAT